eukprot:4988300-Amphidinium_carterae.1
MQCNAMQCNAWRAGQGFLIFGHKPEVAIQSVRLGGIVMDSCTSGCHGVVDTGDNLQKRKLDIMTTTTAPAPSKRKSKIIHSPAKANIVTLIQMYPILDQ